MQRRPLLALIAAPMVATLPAPAQADGSDPSLASFYDRHMVLVGGVAHAWTGQGPLRRMHGNVLQVGVSEDAWFALHENGKLLTRGDTPARPAALVHGVVAFASGQSGWMVIDAAGVLWHGSPAQLAPRRLPRRLADDVVACCVGDGADYYIRRDGTLWVHGLAHRGQYGDGRLTATADFVSTAQDVVAVKAHTGHALYLDRSGRVMGTGGNRFGPLGPHGLGDKADRWGLLFDGARAIATGSRHSVAIRSDGSLWAWGEGFDTTPRRLIGGVAAVAAGNTATIALLDDGRLLQWDGGAGPRELRLT